jgi:hypothetical protein
MENAKSVLKKKASRRRRRRRPCAARADMTVPSHPFELAIYGRDGHLQVREYQSLDTAMAAANSLRPATTQSYRLSVVLAVYVFPGNWRKGD